MVEYCRKDLVKMEDLITVDNCKKGKLDRCNECNPL